MGERFKQNFLKEKGVNGKSMEPKRKISGIWERNKLGGGGGVQVTEKV